MLEITAYASGSTGNCYTLTNGEATIMLECGLPFREIQHLAGYDLPDAVLVTHEHHDHALACEEFMRRGVCVWMTRGTADMLSLSGHRLVVIEPYEVFYPAAGISAKAFPTQHDAAEPCGFLIDDGEDRVLYATDTYYLRNRFDGLTKVMVEANYSYEILRENIEEGMLEPKIIRRLTKSHFSLENVLEFLKTNDISKVREIWLLHLSRNNSDPELFKKLVMMTTGKPVYVANRKKLR